MVAGYSVSIVLGIAGTFGLLFIMQLLIATGKGAVIEAKSYRLVDFVRIGREDIVKTKQDKPEKPSEPEPPPAIPSTDSLDSFEGAIGVSISSPVIDARMNVGGVGFGVSDGEFLPIVKVAPIYPARAASRGLEGYVMLEFTVIKAGTVKDVVLLESTSPIFERPAVEAAHKFKYKPRVIDGEPVEVAGVLNKITFALER